jgi:hypothetical protein
MNKKILIFLLICVFLVFIYYSKPESNIVEVSNFEECVAQNYSVMESYPRQCRTPDGETFVEDIGNEIDKMDLISSYNPRPNQEIFSPLFINGQARGYWFFEASFPVKLLDGNGNEIAFTIAQAQDEWMTEDFVPFEAVLEFEKPDTENGVLVFQKDNPSGLLENSDELIVPIKFSDSVRNVQLYYYNAHKDQEMFEYISCGPEAVFPVDREIALTQTPIQDVINLLLEGNLTPSEKEAGFNPMFPLEGVELVGANLKDGVLTLEFDDPMNLTSGGSCRAGILWHQISKTAKQFSEVESVRFMPEELFQP